MSDQPPGAWSEAIRQQLEAVLKCTKCGTVNIQGASPLVTIGPRLVAECSVCGHDFMLVLPRER